ncbi:unnamed protein product [Effrenium voratum]|nr:unnamed protein product [Effrenium voratum]
MSSLPSVPWSEDDALVGRLEAEGVLLRRARARRLLQPGCRRHLGLRVRWHLGLRVPRCRVFPQCLGRRMSNRARARRLLQLGCRRHLGLRVPRCRVCPQCLGRRMRNRRGRRPG